MGLTDKLLTIYVSGAICMFLLFCYYIYNKKYRLTNNQRRRHNWKPINSFLLELKYCAICESLINIIGSYCDYCNLHADNECIQEADSLVLCKPISTPEDTKNYLKHHWIRGNVHNISKCFVCTNETDELNETDKLKYQCCWCQKIVHDFCLDYTKNEKCDFGSWRDFIVPPWCVKKGQMYRSFMKKRLFYSIKDPEWHYWTPLIIVVNPKSGGGEGDYIATIFRHILNPIQVIDLYSNLKNPIQILESIENRKVYVTICGGDGTITSTISQIKSLNISFDAVFVIIPSGTGNDLSRALNWGNQLPSTFSPNDFLKNLTNGQEVFLDRWLIEIETTFQKRLHLQNKTYFMYNYFSIGVDAQVTYNFHQTRKNLWYFSNNRFINKFMYLMFGTQEIVNASYRNLNDFVDIYLDGKLIDLPEIESIVILNINSWGAGVNLWELGSKNENYPKQEFNDGKLEIIGIESSFQMAKFQMGIDAPFILGQATQIKIILKNVAAVQIDGEPWKQHSATINISLKDQIKFLKNISEIE